MKKDHKYKKYSSSQKRNKLSIFNSVYYKGNPNNWKISRLPDWMNFYGTELFNELNGETPRYYPQFEQGTIVMVNYGVPIGDELGGKHFGVVISNNDTKYKRKVLIVPLSSHYHRGYINLGYELMNGIIELINDRANEIKKEIDSLIKEMRDFSKAYGKRDFSFTDKEKEILLSNGIDIMAFFKNNSVFQIQSENTEVKRVIHQIHSINSWNEYKNISEFVFHIEKIFSFQSRLLKRIADEQKTMQQLTKLSKKFERYNKQSFAIISDIKVVSKLRVQKLTHFTISGNTRISALALNKIKAELIKTIE